RGAGRAPATIAAAALVAAAPLAAGDLADVRGQPHAKRALEVAAAGGHNVLLIGPPGSGKTMLARRLPSILPPLGLDEAIEVTVIHSVAGLLDGRPLVTTRPVRAPHCSISDAALLGGGSPIRPGEVTLAHRGVLFMDELPEFRRNALEPLRQPLEEHRITIARGTGAVTFPAAFQLVAAMNPCPCGWLGDPTDQCRCTPPLIDRYRARVSGPLLDRIDLHVEVPRVAVASLAEDAPGGEPSATIRARVVAARARQQVHAMGSQWTLSGRGDDVDAYEVEVTSARQHVPVVRVYLPVAVLARCDEVNGVACTGECSPAQRADTVTRTPQQGRGHEDP